MNAAAARVARTYWPAEIPDTITLTSVRKRDGHPDYMAAKTGDREAASRLVTYIISETAVDRLRRILGDRKPILLPVYAIGAHGRNIIPDIFAHGLAGHTRATGLSV